MAASPDPGADPVIRQYRERITDNDRAIVEAVNARLRLVRELKAYKDHAGLGFVDPQREEHMLAYALRANRGPLSDDGLRRFFATLLELTKSEVADV
jgi:chorismate mutase